MISIITLTKVSKLKLFIVLLVLLLAIVAIALIAEPKSLDSPTRETNSTAKPGYHIVAEVIDGDTIKVSIDGKAETVRLIGIDAPELPNDCFSREAKSKARKTLQGQPIKLEADQSQDNRDRYGRLLRYVILEDGTNFNRLMIAKGYALEFTFISPYNFQTEFRKAQAAAKKNEVGLWSPDTCI
jgi:micrococcal nuclease